MDWKNNWCNDQNIQQVSELGYCSLLMPFCHSITGSEFANRSLHTTSTVHSISNHSTDVYSEPFFF